MKAIMVLFDSLNRHMLPPYGCDWVHAPNFKRLAERSVTFDQSWSGSMPCMPARRDLHTSRYNFLHRCWGPLEPFDDSVPETLKKNGVYTHLTTDHYHYFEAGGANYHTKYNSWSFFRGQEGDPWVGQVADPDSPELIYEVEGFRRKIFRQDFINREFMKREEEHPQAQTFANGLDFMRRNHGEDRWFLQIEAFDPHEPFFSYSQYKELYPHDYTGAHFDWPLYRKVTETPEQVRHARLEYAALLSMCDKYLGQVMDRMDEYHMWEDTLLIVTTDHGFLLGEHGWWAKDIQPFYNEVVRTPMFIWDPRSGKRNTRNHALVQMIDMGPTLLEYFGVPASPDMMGQSLRRTIESGEPVHDSILFGDHGGYVNCTDGRYVYMRAPRYDNGPLHHYTLMPLFYDNTFTVDELKNVEWAQPFTFTKGLKTMKFKAKGNPTSLESGTLLFDLLHDPGQQHPLQDAAIEHMMVARMTEMMVQSDAPLEQYERLGLEFPDNLK